MHIADRTSSSAPASRVEAPVGNWFRGRAVQLWPDARLIPGDPAIPGLRTPQPQSRIVALSTGCLVRRPLAAIVPVVTACGAQNGVHPLCDSSTPLGYLVPRHLNPSGRVRPAMLVLSGGERELAAVDDWPGRRRLGGLLQHGQAETHLLLEEPSPTCSSTGPVSSGCSSTANGSPRLCKICQDLARQANSSATSSERHTVCSTSPRVGRLHAYPWTT